ncbi:MAG TPA: hypothetical protein VMU70_00065 [Candidatus Tyrphobacter sp.]|nr:hypothetical protein [Candidatus Tyrphobacter sp.]
MKGKINNWLITLIALVLVAASFFAFKHFEPKDIITAEPATLPAVYNQGATSTSQDASSTSPAASYFGNRTDPVFGRYLTDDKGMALYVFDQDSLGVSNCSGRCLEIWPAYGPASAVDQGSLPAGAGTITRPDGSLQFTWNGRPLYHYAPDRNPGDILGNDIGGIWHLVKI